MKTAPAFQMYPADFLAGTAMLTAEETGAYTRLLCLQWQQGYIPQDHAALARFGGIKERKLPRVLEKFEPCADGKYRNKRLEATRADMEQYRERQRENGKKGGRPPKPKPNPSLTNTQRVGYVSPNPNESSQPQPLSHSSETGRESAPQTSSTRRGAPAFPSLMEVVAYASSVMATPECAEAFYNAKEGDGWTTRHGHTVADWRAIFRNWATQWKSNEAARPKAQRNAAGQRAGEIPTDTSIKGARML